MRAGKRGGVFRDALALTFDVFLQVRQRVYAACRCHRARPSPGTFHTHGETGATPRRRILMISVTKPQANSRVLTFELDCQKPRGEGDQVAAFASRFISDTHVGAIEQDTRVAAWPGASH